MLLLNELQEKYDSYVECETFIMEELKKIFPGTLTSIHSFDTNISFSHWIHRHDGYDYDCVVNITYCRNTKIFNIQSLGDRTKAQVKYFLNQLKILLDTERKENERKSI